MLMPYRLQFKGDAQPYSPVDYFRATDNWAVVPRKESINGAIALIFDNKVLAFGDELRADDLEGEPSNVEQVFVARWIGDLISLRSSSGCYLSLSDDGIWKANSRAVNRQSQFIVESIGRQYAFKTGSDYLGNSPHSLVEPMRFTVIRRHDQPAGAARGPLTVKFLKSKVGRALTSQEIESLRDQDAKGRLNEALLDLRAHGSSDRRC